MFYQNDPLWKDKSLNNSSETIGSVGCLLTSLCSINNLINDNKITPIDLDRDLILYNGYTNGNLIIWAVVEHILNLEIVHHYKGDIDYSLNDFYIVNYINYGYGHFTNLISKKGKEYNVFDVWDNHYRNNMDIRRVVKVSKKG
jgi:hypothetical protein